MFRQNMLGVSNATACIMQTTTLLHMQDRQGVSSHGNSSRETLQCKQRGGRKVCIISQVPVDDTFTSKNADCAAAAAAAAAAVAAAAAAAAAAVAAAVAAAAAAVKMTVQICGYECKVMHAEDDSLFDSGASSELCTSC